MKQGSFFYFQAIIKWRQILFIFLLINSIYENSHNLSLINDIEYCESTHTSNFLADLSFCAILAWSNFFRQNPFLLPWILESLQNSLDFRKFFAEMWTPNFEWQYHWDNVR